MNDASEIRHALELFRKWIEVAHPDRDAEVEVDAMRNRLVKTPVFVTSFSKNQDSPALWKAYVGNVPGVSIALDFNHWNVHEQRGTRRRLDVLYTNDFEDIETETDWPLEGFLEDEEDEEESYWNERWGIGSLAGIKHPSFAQEQETRLVTVSRPVRSPSPKQNGPGWKPDIRYRYSNRLMTPYIVTDFTGDRVPRAYLEKEHPEQLLPIKEIVVGPIGDFSLIRTAIESALTTLDYADCRIRQSEVPLRY